MIVLTDASMKGGVGKTTLSTYLSQTLAHLGYRVLVVDMDHNNNLTDYFCREVSPEKLEARNIYHVLTGSKTMEEVIYPIELGIDMIPCTPDLVKIEMEMAMSPMMAIRFKNRLQELDYDYVLIDTHPGYSLSLTAAILAADYILSPVSMDRWNLKGSKLLQERVDIVTEDNYSKPKMIAVASNVTETDADKLVYVYGDSLAESRITRQAIIRKNNTEGKRLKPTLKGHMKAWNQFQALAQEVVSWGK